MYLKTFFNYYKIGRFVLALTLLIALQMAGLPYAIPSLMAILLIYSGIALLRFIIAPNRIIYVDFTLDIVFVSAMVFMRFDIYSYLTLLYLFPIFFASILIKTKRIFFYPVFAGFLYALAFSISGNIVAKESILNILLHLLAFILIALAGQGLKVRMEKQDAYIKRLEEEKIKMQGYERLYRVSADLAHEIRNPLASISAAVQFLMEGRRDKEFFAILDTETTRLTNLVNDFLMFSRPADAPKEEVDLSEVLTHAADSFGSDKDIRVHLVEKSFITANRTYIEAALRNIISNAVEAAKSTIDISVNKNHRELIVSIEDDGPGVSAEMKDKLFEPFVTTKPAGTGLGLAIAYRIIAGFGGSLTVDKSKHGGAKFEVIFPKEGER